MTRHHAGHLWTLDGDRWTAAPDLVVTTSGDGKDREFSPGRDPGRKYGALSAACEAEVRIAEAQRERVLAEMEREERERAEREHALAELARAAAARAEAREEAARAYRAAVAAREKRNATLMWAAVLAYAVLACVGLWWVA